MADLGVATAELTETREQVLGRRVTRLPLSAFVITFNEAVRLPKCLEALRTLVEEIIVVDSGSTDCTVEVATAYGARVFHREWTGYGPQKRFAEEQCSNDWVLNVDADEVITPELTAEINALFTRGIPEPAAYRVRILTVYPGCSKPRLWANDYNVVRLYHKAIGSYRAHPVYDRVETGEHELKQLRAPIYHSPHLSIAHAVKKAFVFSEFRAGQSDASSKPVAILRLLIEFPLVFMKSYFGRRHFTGGWRGFYFSLSNAFMRTTRIALMLEAKSSKPSNGARK
jgi:glycosyltransferase involved in cell wall biosynthesis